MTGIANARIVVAVGISSRPSRLRRHLCSRMTWVMTRKLRSWGPGIRLWNRDAF